VKGSWNHTPAFHTKHVVYDPEVYYVPVIGPGGSHCVIKARKVFAYTIQGIVQSFSIAPLDSKMAVYYGMRVLRKDLYLDEEKAAKVAFIRNLKGPG
jgi:hypothetical protein